MLTGQGAMHRSKETWFAAAVLSSCAVMGTPRIEDAQAPREFNRQLHPPPATCRREVKVLPPGTPVERPYTEIATLSVTCYPGALTVCDERLRESACEKGADAVIVTPSPDGGTPPGASTQSLVARHGRAIRYQDD